MWCWRRVEKISWTDHVRMKKYDIQSSGRGRLTGLAKSCEGNCLLQHIIEGRKKGKGEVKTRKKT
jgi:hypothetical protein